VLRQLDRHLTIRLVLPLLPLFVFFHVRKESVLTPELFGALAMVLSARLLADSSFQSAFMKLVFCILPLVGGGLTCAGKGSIALSVTYYATAGVGTVLAVISDLRQRR